MTINVLILCIHGSIRSVSSGGMLNHWAQKLGEDVCVYSAGSTPSGRLNPFALEALTSVGINIAGYRSKNWDEFVADGAPQIHIVIIVYDSTATEQCPCWSGSPVEVHWGYADPSSAPDDDEGKRQALEVTRRAIGCCMLQLLTLPPDTLPSAELQTQLKRIPQD